MNCFELLDIKPTSDKRTIRDAYIEKVKLYHPEEDEEGFKKIRKAYEESLKYDEKINQNYDSNNLEKLLYKLKNLYSNFFERIDTKCWIELLHEDICFDLELSKEAENTIISFIMDNYYIPQEVYRILNNHFAWTDRHDELCEKYSSDFVNFLYANINGVFKLNYYAFKKEDNVNYDKFIENYYNGLYSLNNNDIYNSDKYIKTALDIINYHEDILILKSKLLLKVDSVDEAIKSIDIVLKSNPKKAEAYFIKASALFRKGKKEEAYSNYRDALNLDKDNYYIMKGVADTAYGLKKYEISKKYYNIIFKKYYHNKLLKNKITSINYFLIDEYEKEKDENYKLARCYFENNQYDKSLKIAKNIEMTMEDSIQIKLLIANIYYELKKLDKAFEYFSKVIKIDNYNGEAYGGLAAVCHDLNKYEEALSYYDKAISYNYALDVMYNNKSSLLCTMERYEEALDSCNEAIKINNSMCHAYKNKGIILFDLGMYEEALECCDTAIDIDEDFVEAYSVKIMIYNKLKKYITALDVYGNATKRGLVSSSLLFQKGKILYNLENYDDALKLYIKALSLNNKNAEIYLSIGHVYYIKEDYINAISYYKEAVERKGNNPYYHFYLGDAYRAMNNSKAIDEYTISIKNIPDKSYFYYVRGKSYLNNKQYDKAILDFNEAISLDSNKYEYYYGERALAYRKLKNYDMAVKDAKKALEINDNYYLAYNELGDIALDNKEYNESLDYFEKVVNVNSKYYYAWVRIGDIYFQLKKYNKAKNAYKKSLESKTKISIIYYNLGKCYYYENNLSKTLDWYNKAINIDVNNDKYYLERGRLFIEMGDKNKARSDLKNALKINKNNTEAAYELKKISNVFAKLFM